MKPHRWLLWSAFVLASVPSLASADEPSLVDWVKNRVQAGLVKPLKESEGGRRFSRGRPPPAERRIRVLSASATKDPRGKSFVPFAVDVRFGGGEWSKDDILGCAYRDTGELFVKSGEEYRPAAFLLGKDLPAVAGACQAAPPPPAPPPQA